MLLTITWRLPCVYMCVCIVKVEQITPLDKFLLLTSFPLRINAHSPTRSYLKTVLSPLFTFFFLLLPSNSLYYTPPMFHHSTHLRNLAKSNQDPKKSMDPTHKKHPKSPPFTTTTKPHPKPQEPPTNIYSPNVQNISNHFSRLYSNHKAQSSSTGGHPHPQPCLDTNFQAKAMSVSTNGDNYIRGSRKFRRNVTDLGEGFPRTNFGGAEVKEKEGKSIEKSSEEHLDTKREIVSYEVKNSKKKGNTRVEVEGDDLKKKIVAVEPNQEIEVLKGLGEGCVKRPSFSVAGIGGGDGNEGRRRSFCSSQTELSNFLSCNGVKVVSADMPSFMQIHAVDCARKTYDSLEKFTAKTLASTLKKEFDVVYGAAWHCIVGTSFGSFVTHSVGGFLYFSMDHKLYILLFKTTVQKAE